MYHKIISCRLKIPVFATVLLFLAGAPQPCFAESGNKILYINSYHPGYQWSDGIEFGIVNRLLIEDVWFKTIYMDSKRNRKPEQIDQAVMQVRQSIEHMKPDVVITSDDNAAKFVIVPHYKNSSIPFVFCGINGDAIEYGLPFVNTTGMIEVAHISSLVDLLSDYTRGKRLGFLSIDALSGHRTLQHYMKKLDREFEHAYFVNTVEEWKDRYRRLQTEVDMMILENPKGIEGWSMHKARKFIEQETRIPTGSTHLWLAPLTLISIGKIPQEQGWWAADAAIKILRGKKPAEIPVVTNKEAKLLANLKLAEKLGITLSQEILEIAGILDE